MEEGVIHEIWILIVSPLITGVIILLVEYWIIIPINTRMNYERNSGRSTQFNLSTKKHKSGGAISPEFIYYYHKLAVGFLGVLSGITFSIILRLQAADYAEGHREQFLGAIASFIATSDFFFSILILCCALGGGVASVAVDFAVSDTEIVFWLRLVTAIIFGFVGAVLCPVMVLLAITGLVIYSLLTEGRRQNGNNSTF
jgi:hypothetical protein